MIKLMIVVDGTKIATEFKMKKSNLQENSAVVRELEKVKLELLDKEYEIESEINIDNELNDDDINEDDINEDDINEDGR